MPTKNKTPGTPFVQFRASELEQALTSRKPASDSHGLTAKRDLTRYYQLLKWELQNVRKQFTQNEILALCDAANGTSWDALTASLLWAEVLDADLEQWKIDKETLVQKLRNLTPVQAVAVIDAVEQWWLLPSRTPAELRTVGLQ